LKKNAATAATVTGVIGMETVLVAWTNPTGVQQRGTIHNPYILAEVRIVITSSHWQK